MENSSHTLLSCLIVDDDPKATKSLKNHISKINFLKTSFSCHSVIEAKEILKKHPVDLMFLDIHLLQFTAIGSLKDFEKVPMTIFTATVPKYAPENYPLFVVDYLSKPISYQCFFNAALKASHILREKMSYATLKELKNNKKIFFNINRSYIPVILEHIMYIESLENYLRVFIKKEKKPLITRQTMQSIEEVLPQDLFCRVHKSFLINLYYIERFDASAIYINGKEIPIAQNRKKEFKQIIANIYNPSNIQ